MPQDQQPSGVDLARVALKAAKEAARKNGGRAQQPKPRTVRPARRDGRDPMGLSDVLGALVAERAWQLPAAGATLRERWAAIAPELAGHVAAVAFDADSGRLTVRPESSAWATKTRLEQARVIEAANTSAGRTVVRTLRILPPGALPAAERPDAEPTAAAAPSGPVRVRETASDGYRRALAAHQAAKPDRPVDPELAAAYERQTRALIAQRNRAFTDQVPAKESWSEPTGAYGDPHRRALARARAERAARARQDAA